MLLHVLTFILAVGGIISIAWVFSTIIETDDKIKIIDKKVDSLVNYQPRPRYYPSDSD